MALRIGQRLQGRRGREAARQERPQAGKQEERLDAGLLLRVSSPGQEDGYSLADQERDGRAYCQKMGFRLQEHFIWNDGAQKSYTLNRPGLQAAFEAIRKREIQVLVVGRYDRFSRIQLQQAVAIYQIEQVYGGRVESADPREQFGRDSTGTLLRSVNAWRAEQELELIRARTQGGRRSRAQSGKLIAAPFPLYGYFWADPDARRGKTRYLVDPETAPIVERIYKEVAAGVPLRQVALYLIDEHVPTPAQILLARKLIAPDRFKIAGVWSRTMIRRIVSHPAYCGQYVAFRTHTTIVNEHDERGEAQLKSKTRLRAEDDPARTVLSQDICPPIVSEALWEQANAQLMRNKEEAARNNRHLEATLLRGGYAICGYCGARMTASANGPREKKFYEYRCQTRGYVISPCPGGAFGVRAETLDTSVWLAIRYLFSNPARVRAILTAQLQDQEDVDARAGEQKKALEGQLHEIEAQLENATRAVLRAQDDQSHALWSAQVDRLLPQREGLRQALDQLDYTNEKRTAALSYLQTVEEWCTALGAAIAEASYQEKRFLIRGLKARVTCFRIDHDPKYIVDWDLAGLREELRELLPRMTDGDIATYCDLNNTYFRHQSADYVPGSGFVAVAEGAAPDLGRMALEEAGSTPLAQP